MQKVVISFLLYSVLALGGEDSRRYGFLTTWLQNAQNYPTQSVTEQGCHTEALITAQETNPFSDCLNAICGPPELNYTIYDFTEESLAENYSPQSSELKNLENYFQNFYSKKINYQLDKLKKLKDLIEQGKTAIAPELRPFLAMQFVIGQLNHLNPNTDINPQGIQVDHANRMLRLGLNEEVIRTRFAATMPPDTARQLYPAFLSLIQHPLMAQRMYGNYFGWNTTLGNLDPTKETSEVLADRINEFKNLSSTAGAELNTILAPIGGFPLESSFETIDQIESTSDLNENLIGQFETQSMQLKLYSEFLIQNQAPAAFESFMVEDYSELFDMQDMLTSVDAAITRLELLKESPDNYQTDFQYCAPRIAHALAVLPTQEEKQEFQNRLDPILLRLYENMSSMFSEATKEKLLPYYGSIDIVLPGTKSNFEQTLVRDFTSLNQSLDHSIAAYNELENQDQMTLNFMNNYLSWNQKDYLNNFEDVCAQYNGQTAVINDHAADLESISKLNISPFVLKNPDITEGVLAHELAHITKNFLKNNNEASEESMRKFATLRNCVTSLHPTAVVQTGFYPYRSLGAGSGNIPGVISNYTEEDYADALATTVRGEDNRNIACIFLQSKYGDYVERELEHTNEDPHSTDLFRVLHMENIHRGELPMSCSHALNSTDQNRNFHNCLKPIQGN
ncbi:MAG: hypothetical protein CME62_00770 [Halobacteriovoraceae bacterium]|nr:hypothetical protein [Halobacteriovoraceae bacterium]|tara:strand:- start:3858 stop:5894 length:2037 start_codon:yes stop_codon:yes gene_type:complete